MEVLPPNATGATGDSVLELRIDDAYATYEGHSGAIAAKVVVWLCLWFPSWWIDTDRFALTARAHWRLVESRTRRLVGEGDVEGRQSCVLGDLSGRGWYVLDFLRIPGCLTDKSWHDIARLLTPGTEDSLAEAIVVAAESAAASR